ncbi:MAG TPA: dienelactone hydrolase family protein [Alphaproteobacteria bacterium]|nr:dienelactone hydrolase family protein [Alphaproteobacteria bacterium]
MQTPHYLAKAQGTPKGGLVLLHEAFGLTPHIRAQADKFAALGYTTLAPDMLVPSAPLSERDDNAWQSNGIFSWLPQNKAGLDLGRDLIVSTRPEQVLAIVAESVASVKNLGLPIALPIATIGYCWGGSVSFVASKQVPGLACAVCYYGGRIAEIAAQPPAPAIPVLVHTAKLDRYIPYDEAMQALRTHTPGVEVYGYNADHGFNRDDGPTYDAAVAGLALERTLAFFSKHLK